MNTTKAPKATKTSQKAPERKDFRCWCGNSLIAPHAHTVEQLKRRNAAAKATK